MNTTIPFSGFYYSIHDSELDEALKMDFSDDTGCHLISEELYQKAFDLVDWRQAHNEYAKAYCEAFSDKFNLDLEFDELVSPKYYNFETDRIFAHISLETVTKLFNAIDKEYLNEVIKSRFTSYDGFCSFYPNDLSEWPSDLSEWDCNHIGTLIQAFVELHCDNEFTQFNEYEVFEYGSYETCYHILNNQDNEELTRLYNIAYYLRTRQERKYK